jgi:predicted nucleic acid-binding Zn ribbon protein
LTQVTEGAERGNFWRAWLTQHLPAELGQHLSGAAEREGTLVVFADSSAWSARLRYALAELEPQIRAASAALHAVRVRVLPRS